MTAARAPLRVGLLIDGTVVPRWVADAIEDVDACAVAEIVGRVVDGRSRPRARRPLHELYRRLDQRAFGTDLDPLDQVALPGRVRRLAVVAGADVDVVLSFGGDARTTAIDDPPRYGVWCLRVDDPRGFAGAPVWESRLERPARDGGIDVLYRSVSASDPLSLHRTRARVCAKSAKFVVRKLHELHRDGELSVLEHIDHARGDVWATDVATGPQLLRFGGRAASRLARRTTRKAVSRQQWFIAYQRRRGGLPTPEGFRDATVLPAPGDRFYADPCLVEWRDATYVFFEELRFAEERGVISWCRLTPDGRCTAPQIALERPYHLSYPFVFCIGDTAFMLPEASANGAIELYRADPFPSAWTLDRVLLTDVRAVDPTLIEHAGRLWLFANIGGRGTSNDDELFLFSSQTLTGPWEPHPRNPVVSDVRRARPAGRPFLDEDGSLIRPSQDCSGTYGSAVVFNRVDVLTETEYREAPIGGLGAAWRPDNLGTHTYTRSALWEAIDGRAWVPRLSRSRMSRPGSSSGP